jgi:hypothetical protein
MWYSNRFLKSNNGTIKQLLGMFFLILSWLALKKFGLFELNIEVCGAVLVIVYLAYLLFRQIKKRNLSIDKSLQIELPGKKNKWNIYNYLVTAIGVYSIVSTELNTSIYSWTILNYLTVLIIMLLSLLVYSLYKGTSYEKRFLMVQNNELHFIECESTYYASISDFKKIEISYNKISAIAKDGRSDRLGGYEMSDGDLLSLVAFLENNTTHIELEVLFEKTNE